MLPGIYSSTPSTNYIFRWGKVVAEPHLGAPTVHPRCTYARKHTKTFWKNLNLCGNDHQQMLERLAMFGGQMTSEENCTNFFYKFWSNNARTFWVILSFLYRAPRMSFDHQNLQASLAFLDNHSHKVSDFFEMFWYVFFAWVHRGCTEDGCRNHSREDM